MLIFISIMQQNEETLRINVNDRKILDEVCKGDFIKVDITGLAKKLGLDRNTVASRLSALMEKKVLKLMALENVDLEGIYRYYLIIDFEPSASLEDMEAARKWLEGQEEIWDVCELFSFANVSLLCSVCGLASHAKKTRSLIHIEPREYTHLLDYFIKELVHNKFRGKIKGALAYSIISQTKLHKNYKLVGWDSNTSEIIGL